MEGRGGGGKRGIVITMMMMRMIIVMMVVVVAVVVVASLSNTLSMSKSSSLVRKLHGHLRIRASSGAGASAGCAEV